MNEINFFLLVTIKFHITVIFTPSFSTFCDTRPDLMQAPERERTARAKHCLATATIICTGIGMTTDPLQFSAIRVPIILPSLPGTEQFSVFVFFIVQWLLSHAPHRREIGLNMRNPNAYILAKEKNYSDPRNAGCA